LADASKLAEWKHIIDDHGLEINALSCHGNPLHPDIAKSHQQYFRNTVLMSEKIGVRRVITFSGCQGDSDGIKYPN
jgi:sugar phosphate isomerase/epimerase